MADNFNLAKFLRNNQLLNEGIGGYKDIEPMREENQIDYADYGVDPEDPDADTIVSFMQTMRDFDNMKDPSFIDNFKDWLKGIKANYKFGKKAYDAGFRMNEADEEQAYFDYKRSGEDSDVSWDDFDRPEVQKYDRMMGLAHEEFMGISDIVSMTIDSLRHDGFDDQDILNFLATDFSLDEGLDEAEMEGEEFDWKPIDQQGKTPFKNLTVTITGDEMKVKSDDGFDSQSYTKDDIKKAMKTGEYLRFRGKNLQLNTKMKAWANS